MKKFAFLSVLLQTALTPAWGQDRPVNENKMAIWLPLQLIPSFVLYQDDTRSRFGFEWEVTPVLYSFGMNDQISSWYSFVVEPTARFVGSVELTLAGQIFTAKAGTSYFSSSAQVMGFIPLFERGEHLTLNLGAGIYQIAGETRVFKIAGISTLFGILHLHVKHADRPTAWIGSLEFRVF